MTTDPGTLYVVATPIGNLDDISARARDVLAKVEMVAAEDTRRAAQLLTRLGCRNQLVSLHEHNESERVEEILEMLIDGMSVALISDAGTPLISDPGYRLLAAAREKALAVCPVPGSCAAIAALSVAGLPTDRFRFEGFLPARAVARKKRLEQLAGIPETMIFYESVHRVRDMLNDMEAAIGSDRPIAVARELTKLHETLYRGTVAQVRAQLDSDAGGGKGEFTIVMAGKSEAPQSMPGELERVLGILLGDLSTRTAAVLAARITGAGRGQAYRAALRLQRQDSRES